MVVRPIDRFVSALHRESGDELLLESGKTGRVRIGTQERVLLAQAVRTDQIELLLRDALPAEHALSLRQDGQFTFPYQAATGMVTVHVRRHGDRLGVSIKPRIMPAPSVGRHQSVSGRSEAAPRAIELVPVADSISGEQSYSDPLVVPSAPQRAADAPPDGDPISMDLNTGSLLPPPLSTADLTPIAPASTTPPWVQDAPPGGLNSGAQLPATEARNSRGANVAAGRGRGPNNGQGGANGQGPARRVPTLGAPIAGVPQAPAQHGASQRGAFPGAAPPARYSAPAPVAPAHEPTHAVHSERTEPVPIVQMERPAPVLGEPHQIDPILMTLVKSKASDLHMTANLAPRMRKDGDIQPVPGFEAVLASETIESWLMEVAPPKSRAKFAETSDADFAYELPGIARLRVNAFRDRRGVGGVIRTIPATVLTADQLKLPQVIRDFCTLHKGLVVVTGPTGSGKSTTLAAMVDLINKTRSDHVITIEDPVEFVHVPQKCLVNQREVHTDTASFSTGVRAALREDPDVILVGEMRDLETISIAIESAETGHFVLGTLHTTTAVSTVDRIIDQFPTDRQSQIRVMLSTALRGVVAQTLCKKSGGGRIAALEVLVVLPAVANLIREGKTFQIASVMQTGKNAGMQTLNDALFALVQEGMVAPDEALNRSLARQELRTMLERAGKAA